MDKGTVKSMGHNFPPAGDVKNKQINVHESLMTMYSL